MLIPGRAVRYYIGDEAKPVMAVPLQVSPVAPFDPHVDANSLCQRWKRWVQAFELYVGASGVKDDNQKRQLLLHCAGMDVQDIFYTLPATGTDYKTAKDKLTAHLTPKQNTSYNRHVFRKEVQKEGESVWQFVTRLRQLAALCEFGDQVDDFIRDQVVYNCRSKRLRTKLLAEQDLTLDRTLALSAATEAAEHQAAQIAHDGERVSAVATRVRENTRPRSSRQRAQGGNRSQAPQDNKPTCNRCGTRGHTGDVCQRTKGKKCFKCGQQGHFSSVCKQSTTHEEPPNPGVRYVSEPSSGSDDDYMNEYAYATSLSKSVTVTVGDVPISMLIDSGSTWNTLNSECKERLVQQGIALVPCKRRIHPYNSPPIPVHQLVKTKISLDNGEELQAEFLIVEGTATPLLGKGTAESLGILQVSVNHVIGGNCYTDELVKRFPRLWTGIGCLKGVQVKLHIDHSVPPVAQKHNRVPFHKQAKVAKEIAKLEAEDIIERVSGPTEWVSRIVTPPKPKKPDEIRLCVDMRAANKASLRTRHVTPTVDELITNFSGATVFSKLDLRSGYHQLVLHPSSRYITTFSTHLGLYRYKRLSFGINAAAEVFQHEIQSVIDGVAGAVNISDDIAVFGVDQATHDRALEETLTRLHDAGLTVNVVKCEFRRSRIEFFGLVFSKDGISPDPKKVADLHAATEPKNPSEVRSFLGMAQFSARFIRDYAP